MFSSLEMRKVNNGFVVTVNNDDETEEFVFSNLPKTIKFVKDLANADDTSKKESQ